MTALIVDDERLARQELRRLLAAYPEVHVIGEAADVESAVSVIAAQSPSVVFLDVQLAGETGFDLLERAPGRYDVIFVTAYEHHALRAFEVNALDYLLKPVQQHRLTEAISRLAAVSPAAKDEKPALRSDDRVLLSIANRRFFVAVADIVCVRAEGDYSRVFATAGREAMVSRSLQEWEARLPPNQFARIHRSTIVNLDRVQVVEPSSGSSFLVRMRGIDAPLTMSRRHASRLRDRMR